MRPPTDCAGRRRDLFLHGRQPVEVELGVFHEDDRRFHHIVLEVMVTETDKNGRTWTHFIDLARIDVNRLALKNPGIPYPGIFRLSAMTHPAVIPDESGNFKPQIEAPEQS